MIRQEAAGFALAALARLITGAQGHWVGSWPKAEQRIYFANHQSHADLVMIWAALPEELRSITRQRRAVQLLYLLSFIILLIACINYINLSTARSLERTRRQ